MTSSFTSRLLEKQPDRQTETDRWTGRVERQVARTISHKDTCTGVDFVYCLVKKNLTQYEEGGAGEGGIVKKQRQRGCGVGGLVSMERKRARCSVPSALGFVKRYMIRTDSQSNEKFNTL